MFDARPSAAALAAATVLLASVGHARPLGVEDLLQMEGLGRTVVAGDGRAFLLERRLPYAAGARFDYGEYTPLFRTRIELAEPTRPGPPTPLFPHEAGAGYALGPVSPDGRRAVVFRLKDGRWELGVADLVPHAVAWSGVTPEISETGRSVEWASSRELAILALPADVTPFALRIANPGQAIAARWAASAQGRAAVTVVGSGPRADITSRDPPGMLLLLDVETGRSRRLALGEFKDLELSASGRWAALAEVAEDIRLQAGKPIRGDFGTAKRRRRLVLVDLASGRVQRPCDACDISRHLLSWSDRADELLVFARGDGQPWTGGRLLKVRAADGRVRDLSTGRLRLAAGGISELIGAGWIDGRPIAYGRAPGSASPRLDWWRLDGARTLSLTGRLPDSPGMTGVVSAGDRLLVRSAGRTMQLSAAGRILGALPGELAFGAAQTEGPQPRYGLTFLGSKGAVGLSQGGRELIGFDARGLHRLGLAPVGAELIAADGGGDALVRVSGAGGEDHVLRLNSAGGVTPLFVLNPRLAEVDRPVIREVRHRGPQGEPLSSWLVLPARRTGPPPPLVVWPYLNLAYGTPPSFLAARELATQPAPQLLAGHGYAVLLPSLPVPRDDSTPADRAAQDVLAIVEAAARQPDLAGAFDPQRLGLWGHSFGGYSVAAIVSQTDRFAAGVTWAAAGPNLFAKWGDFGPAVRAWPEQGLANPSWTEDLQGDTRGPPWSTPERFLRGSPALHLGASRTPLLLAHGDLDGFPIAGSEQLFSAYYRRNAEAVMATYWGEGHVLRNPEHLRDFYARGLAWLDDHLGLTPRSPADAAPQAHREPAPASGGPNPP